MTKSVDIVISANLYQFLPIAVFLYLLEIETFSNSFRLHSKYNIRTNGVIDVSGLHFVSIMTDPVKKQNSFLEFYLLYFLKAP